MPGLRALEKYAVRCGGGVNHRMSLSDAALVKDNHVAAAGSVGRRVRRGARGRRPALPVEVECDTLAQVAEALGAGADLILLDNFSVELTAAAVALTAGRAQLEASGRLTIDSARAIARDRRRLPCGGRAHAFGPGAGHRAGPAGVTCC